MQQALEALELAKPEVQLGEVDAAITALEQALADPEQELDSRCPVCGEDGGTSCGALYCGLVTSAPTPRKPEPAEQRNTMPITDDNGKALLPQCRVIEQRGNWFLLYDQHQIGNTVRHEFRIQKLQHDIVLYPGMSLAEAKKRFHEKVEADDE